jgi:hypothetical protein
MHLQSKEKKEGWKMAARVRRGTIFLIMLCILLSTSLFDALAQGETPVFSKPEDAIRHFVAALSENDLQKALQACAVDEYAQGYDFVGMMDRAKALLPMQQMAPSEYDLFAEMNKISAMYTLVNQMKMMIYSFFVPEVKEGITMYVGGSVDDAKKFAEAVDPGKLKNLKLLRIDPPMQNMLNSAKNIENFQKMAALYGAQEMTERIVLYELDGKTYLGGFGVLRYGEGWKIQRLGSNLAGLSAFGTVEETTIDEYVSLL